MFWLFFFQNAAEEGTVSRTVEGMATKTAENKLIKTVVGTKSSIKWIMDWDLTSE